MISVSWWIVVGLIALWAELAIGTFDFLGIAFAALLTAGIQYATWYDSAIVFVISSVVSVGLIRRYMSWHRDIGPKKLIDWKIWEIDWHIVVYTQWRYRRVSNPADLHVDDLVHIQNEVDGKMIVKKIP